MITEQAQPTQPPQHSGPGGPGGPGGQGGPGPGRPPNRGGRGRREGGRRYAPRRKVCGFCVDKIKEVDYKDVPRLRRYLSERAKIEPRRKTGTCGKHQRRLTVAIKQARHLALLPFTNDHIRQMGGSWRPERGGGGDRRFGGPPRGDFGPRPEAQQQQPAPAPQPVQQQPAIPESTAEAPAQPAMEAAQPAAEVAQLAAEQTPDAPSGETGTSPEVVRPANDEESNRA